VQAVKYRGVQHLDQFGGVEQVDTHVRQGLIDGAVEYNGGGDKKYREKIEAALKLFN
jgi:hypothetical protein